MIPVFAAGFTLLDPVLEARLYKISRKYEAGEKATLVDATVWYLRAGSQKDDVTADGAAPGGGVEIAHDLPRAIIERVMCEFEVDLVAVGSRHGRMASEFAGERHDL